MSDESFLKDAAEEALSALPTLESCWAGPRVRLIQDWRRADIGRRMVDQGYLKVGERVEGTNVHKIVLTDAGRQEPLAHLQEAGAAETT